MRPLNALVAALAGVLVTGCSSAPSPAAQSGDPTPVASNKSPSDSTRIRIVVGEVELTGRLFDNSTARDLRTLLPVTLTFADLNGVEKTAPLPRKLAVDGMPDGDDPRVGDLGYWSPDGDLVIYYGDVGYWRGISRIGEVDGDIPAVLRDTGEFTATVESA
ncbi:cyclophilin-like fold protein [Mycolicibacterium lacusdiani]|uniref:cyclophilin-like fold protein n=1 Tax=Mycolicibacterium lacusdiani TaxID=2895283 RepID=UPI001EEF0CC9|nr:cyclophilin-like fold protein [Mycolicibacterium lacusdiani]